MEQIYDAMEKDQVEAESVANTVISSLEPKSRSN